MDIDAHTINTFCAAHGMSRASYYNIRNEGKGPREFRIGSSVRISREAAADWRREREAEAAVHRESLAAA